MGENIVAILHICGSGAIFLQFYDHQDTESDSQKIESGVARPISTH